MFGIKKKALKVNPNFSEYVFPGTPRSGEFCVILSAELDEFWSYVGNKSNQRWTWYALERDTGLAQREADR
jgi:insertion element IS1 protein InsB